MQFKFVLLWTDAALWLLFIALVGYGIRVARAPHLRATWAKALRDPAAMCSAVVLLAFLLVAALDSVHFRRALPPSSAQAAGTVFYDARTESLLDAVLARQLEMRESSYSAPLAYVARKRIEAARAMMLATDQPLTQIAHAHGFCDQSHFTRTFRRETGMSPLLWRQRCAARTEATTER